MGTRRDFVKGAGVAPLALILASPALARAAALGLEPVTIRTASGREVKAALAAPRGPSRGAVLLIHEWWGLNDQIKSVAAELARLGYLALAVDLYDGRVTDDPEEARRLSRSVKADEATETLEAWISWLRSDPRSHGKVATIGWCFGGGWSLAASIRTPVDATVVYYGRVDRTPEELSRLKGPVLGHFATRDRWINQEMVRRFTSAMDAAGKRYEVHWYEADHAFANPTTARYDAEDAELAWRRTLAFLREHIG